MSTPLWVLLAFAGFTLFLLLATIGIFRWSRILTRRAELTDFRADTPHGDFYRRAMRAHANCVENLPVYGAIALTAAVLSIESPLLDALAIAVIVGRIGQAFVHVAFTETNFTVALRFGFFMAQLASMAVMGASVALVAGG